MTNTVRKITMIGMLIAAQVNTGRFISISLPIATMWFHISSHCHYRHFIRPGMGAAFQQSLAT